MEMMGYGEDVVVLVVYATTLDVTIIDAIIVVASVDTLMLWA